MSKSGANVLLIFQCPVICPTPSQVDILVSDDSPAMFKRIFTAVETRAKSELRMRLVPLNLLKLSSIFLLTQSRRYGAAFVDRIFNLCIMFIFVMLSTDLNVKKSVPGITMPP